MASLTVPSPQSASGSFPSSPRTPHRPLSTHGMPKEPRMTSPERPHRFSATGFSPMSFISTPPTQHPRSPGPLSPPMSAKSFGTFIDSEPSTPAYSPRMDHDWDGSTLVLLRPMSSCSEPASPIEPAWEMVKPVKAIPQAPIIQSSNKSTSPFRSKEISTSTSLSSHPIHPINPPIASVKPSKQITVNISDKENESPPQEVENCKETTRDEQIATAGAAPLGKLASRMKSMLKRRNTEKRRLRKERGYYEVDHVEDAHWTEM